MKNGILSFDFKILGELELKTHTYRYGLRNND